MCSLGRRRWRPGIGTALLRTRSRGSAAPFDFCSDRSLDLLRSPPSDLPDAFARNTQFPTKFIKRLRLFCHKPRIDHASFSRGKNGQSSIESPKYALALLCFGHLTLRDPVNLLSGDKSYLPRRRPRRWALYDISCGSGRSFRRRHDLQHRDPERLIRSDRRLVRHRLTKTAFELRKLKKSFFSPA